MPKSDAVGAEAVLPAESGRVFQSALQSALKQATSNVKGIGLLLGAIVVLIGGYYAFEQKLGWPQPWPAVFSAGIVVTFLIVFFVPELRDQIKLQRLRAEGIHGALISPKYFRLTAYDVEDAPNFYRSDGAGTEACKWIEASSSPVLYVSGQSGAGKSSLISAAIIPDMRQRSWVALVLRPHDAPLEEIKAALLRPDAIWQKPPAAQSDVRELVEQATERTRKNGKRLLLIIDQFEETLILGADDAKQALFSWLGGLLVRPVPGLKVVLSLRAEYLNDLPAHGLSPPAFGRGDNAFEVRPFSRAAAQAFIAKSGLDMGPQLLAKVLHEASEIEDMPDRVRPIVLNMFGLILGSFSGSLPKGYESGRLLSRYVELSLKSSTKDGFAAKMLRPLVTDAGTKKTLTIDEIADEAGVESLVARGCLIPLANDGLVRRLPGIPEKWEIAHDFVARLLQPILLSWRRGLWERSRPYFAPVTVGIWALVVAALIFLYPSLHDEYILAELRTVGIVPDPPQKDGLAFRHNRAEIVDIVHFWRIASLLQNLSERTVSLDLSYAPITSLQGMPALPALASLNLSDSQLTSLQGMPSLPALASLDLSTTSITSLQGMPSLPALASLNLSDTQLTRGIIYLTPSPFWAINIPQKEAVPVSKSTISTFELFAMFPDQETARVYLEGRLWPNGPRCPVCGLGERITARKEGFYRCNACKEDFTVRTNTIFERSHVPLHKWIYAMYLLVTARKGISSMQLAKEIGITQKSAWFVLQRLREACGSDLSKLQGIVEIDETYVGGLQKNKHADKRIKGARGSVGKTPVLGMRERGGRTVGMTVGDANRATIQEAIHRHIEPGAELHTDESAVYAGIDKAGFEHETINHGAGEYVRGDVTTNGMESVFAVLKRGIVGVYHHVSPKHLDRYVDEFSFRLNDGNVKNHTLTRLDSFVQGTSGKRLTYKGLIQ